MTSPARVPRPTPRRGIQPVAVPARRPDLRVVPAARPAPRIHRRRTGVVLGVALIIVFGSLMASAVFHGLLVSGQSNLDRMDTQIQEQQSALAREKLELADLQSPSRISAEAAALGMVPAERQHWLSPGTGAAPVVTGDPIDTTATATTTPADAGTATTTPTTTPTADSTTGGATAP